MARPTQSGVSQFPLRDWAQTSASSNQSRMFIWLPGTLSAMAVCFERILVSRRTNFLPTTRYFANNSSRLFKVGDETEVRRIISVKDVQAFAQITGDTNPIHLDDNFAKKTRVGQVIVHGVILNGYCDHFYALYVVCGYVLFCTLRNYKLNHARCTGDPSVL